MNQKSKVFILSFMASFILFTSMPSYVEAAIPVSPTVTTLSAGDNARKDDIQWVYKSVDGVIYRRQYNFTKGKWIGDWEICP